MIFAKGKRGLIYKEKYKGKEVIVKVPHPDSKAMHSINNEIKFLKVINKKGIGPKLISSSKNKIVMEFIDGDLILDFISSSGKSKIISVIKKVFEQMHILDKLGINKLEMTHPHKHIIVRKGKPVLIDFERCRFTEKPKNVTQFCQFITSGKVSRLLKEKGIVLDKEKVMRLAGDYKKSYGKREYEILMNGITANLKYSNI